jgi:hypothetical protein
MLFECFYYPLLDSDGDVVKSYDNLKEFKIGDEVPTKTIYYNYGDNFIIYQGENFFKVENRVLVGPIDYADISFPNTIVFNNGTQLSVSSSKDLRSIRLVLKGEFEAEKELGNLFFLYNFFVKEIKLTQYDVLSTLTNSSTDCSFVNNELDINTENLIRDLNIVKSKISDLLNSNYDIKNAYLNYMSFKKNENLSNLSICKFFQKESKEYNSNVKHGKSPRHNNKDPKVKLEKMLKSCNCNYRLIS